jgi:2-oxoglutarate dehydrogenase E2 component (dihydrolipoamide succinyltransferase)
MATEIRVPTLGESVSEATIAQWFKKPGETIAADEPLVELETDKVTIEVPAPAGGVLAEVLVKDGETVGVGALLGTIDAAGAATSAPAAAPSQKTETATPIAAGPEAVAPKADAPKAEAAKARPAPADAPLAPSVQKLVTENRLDAAAIDGTGKGGRLTKGDVLAAIEQAASRAAVAPAAPMAARPASPPDDASREERVRMSKLRQTIARRLKEAQSAAAMLTTFNDVDMHAVMQLRKDYKDIFEKKHGVRLGFMGFFVKAVIQALKEIPAVNAEIDGTDIIYKNYYHVGVAVGTEKGLVVPVVRDADRLSIAGVEKAINDFGRRARDGQLGLEDMQGGTFTISNGGVYGSLMSTPILNAPQSGILGMHRIDERPVVRGGQIVVRPMMYLALSYDHRIVDGKEAVTFLVRVKEAIEDPQRLVLDL